uniref:Protein nlrc3 n=1 Tax=Tetraselmis sp. GSL018 TaxID=582737 RepID=A0A061SFV2_9CHLO
MATEGVQANGGSVPPGGGFLRPAARAETDLCGGRNCHGAIVTQLARESVSSPREEQGSLRASLRSTSSVVRRSDSAEMGSDVNRLPRPNLPAESSGAGEPCGSRLWHSRRERQQRYKERIWAAFGDRDMEEGIDGSVARFRQEILPRRQCYSSHEMLSRRMNHRRMAHAAEPGPEIGRGLLSSHAVRTAEQVELEMVLFQRRLDTMLRAASGAAPAFNLGMSISSERLFGFLLVALPSYPQVQTLDLSRNSLDDGHMERLSETLMEAGSVTSLDVSYNRLTWLSALALGKLLVKRPRDLGGAHRQLSTLRMDGNHIGSRGTEVLVEALTKNRHLKKLGLQKCAVGPAGGRKLGQLLSETSIVAELDVSWNELGLHGAQHLLSALRVSPCLEVLNLSHNFLGDEEGEQLFEALAHNERLRCLDVSSNFLGPRACASLAEALLANPLTRLEQLTVDDNPCGLRGGVSLLSLLDEGSTTAAIEISAKGCSFAQEAPKEDFDPLEPEGLYHLKLGHEEQRAAAIALLEARNAHSPSAWKVSRLNGKQWRPPGPWSPAPLVRATETNAQEAAPKKKRRKAASRKGQRAAAADAGRASAAPRTTQKGGQAAGGDGRSHSSIHGTRAQRCPPAGTLSWSSAPPRWLQPAATGPSRPACQRASSGAPGACKAKRRQPTGGASSSWSPFRAAMHGLCHKRLRRSEASCTARRSYRPQRRYSAALRATTALTRSTPPSPRASGASCMRASGSVGSSTRASSRAGTALTSG